MKLPDSWSETENLDWKLPLPAAGSSTPIVVKNKIFLTFEQTNEVKAMSIGIEGRELWTRVVCQTKGKGYGEKTHASPTPSSDGKLVFVTAGTAREGVTIQNTGSDPLVSLRYFGPNTFDELPAVGAHKH